MFNNYRLASDLDGDCDLLPPIPERSAVLGTLEAEDRLDNRSLLEFEPP